MHRPIWGFLGRTYHIVRNLMSQLIFKELAHVIIIESTFKYQILANRYTEPCFQQNNWPEVLKGQQ